MKKITIVMILIYVLTACAPTQTPASTAVENYLQALSNKDEDALRASICPEYAFEALVEFDALAQVQTELKDVACQQSGEDETSTYVTCTGSIVSNYGSELFNYDLTGRTYNVIQNEGNWLVCGYTE